MESDSPDYVDVAGIVDECCSLPSWRLSMNRKFNRMGDETLQTLVGDPSFDMSAHVEIENECSALRAALARQQMTIEELQSELDEERNASSSAANEAMSMILRLQREKAEIMMNTTQFKRIAEETMRHDQHEILSLEEIYFKCDQAMEALSFEIEFYKSRLLSHGLHLDYEHHRKHEPVEVVEVVEEEEKVVEKKDEVLEVISSSSSNIKNNNNYYDGFDYQTYPYPPLKCSCTVDKDVDIDIDSGKYMADSDASFETMDFRKQRDEMEFYPVNTVVDNLDFQERAHPISINGCEDDDYLGTPRCPVSRADHDHTNESSELENMYKRLEELEADREMLRNDIISMRTDDTQIVLLQEIAQNLCIRAADEKRVSIKKSSFLISFWVVSLFKVVLKLVNC